MKYELDPEQENLADIYLMLSDADMAIMGPVVTEFRKNNNRLLKIHNKISDAYLDLFEYLKEELGNNEAIYLIDSADEMRSGSWKQMLHTDIRPEDREEVLIADDEDGFVGFAEYYKERDLFQQIEYLYGGYSVLGSKNWKEHDNSVTHYMPLPKPPKKKDRLPLSNEEKNDE